MVAVGKITTNIYGFVWWKDRLLWCTLDGLMVKGQSMTKDGCEWCKSTAWGLPYKDGLNGAMIWHENGMV